MEPTTNSKLLLVEGSDDMHVVINLLGSHGFQPRFGNRPKEVFQQLRKSIYNEVNVSGRDALGILADANDDFVGRWLSLSEGLKRAGCNVPKSLSRAGSVFSGPLGIRVGVWLMPDNRRAGELEDFVHDMISVTDPILPRAKCYIDGIPEGDRRFANAKLTRAYVHAWLATREKPRPMGTAIAAGDLLHDVPVAKNFIDWLRKLFEF